jgi:para-nitrobenzyl esterase
MEIMKQFNYFLRVLCFICLSSIGFFGLMTAIYSCGGGGGGSSSSPAVKSGVFIDSAVQGIEFETPTQKGITDANGTFKYQVGETVTFFIGGIELGKAVGKAEITPVDIVPGATDATHSKVTNICRFLLSLDDDSNWDNGINITQDIINEIEGRPINFDQSINDFANSPDVQNLFNTLDQLGVLQGPVGLCSVQEAQDHLNIFLSGTPTTTTTMTTITTTTTTTTTVFGP